METVNGNRAMIVDDSRAMRMILRKMLSELGYEASEAANGQEALQGLERASTPPALIFIDWNMPVMCGIDLVKVVRNDCPICREHLDHGDYGNGYPAYLRKRSRPAQTNM